MLSGIRVRRWWTKGKELDRSGPACEVDTPCTAGDTGAMPDELPDCCFDEWAACNAKRARKRETAASITSALLSALDDAGLEDRSVLDVGCGTGDLALAAVGRGARSVSGFDLGAGAISSARALARERGLTERAAFEVGDGSQAALPRSDVVVLNRVLCCYPSADALLTNTLGAAGSVFALTAPIDRGPLGLYNRVASWLGNRWYALRAKKFRGFRVFVHDLAAIEELILEAGFVPQVRQHQRLVWDLRVYARQTP
jgi:SAM-dependent methyltransferase